ncbi:hypothetical protein E2C01_015089 [Portunus trituberculatus]|uniref:Uncharacterized protein n=1 Tax=Portunus trituberculatus TaxID=210409 RepID=A0A5B7DLW2_PORTR|nr:hypothetical protein [Portunus trituberculatus]
MMFLIAAKSTSSDGSVRWLTLAAALSTVRALAWRPLKISQRGDSGNNLQGKEKKECDAGCSPLDECEVGNSPVEECDAAQDRVSDLLPPPGSDQVGDARHQHAAKGPWQQVEGAHMLDGDCPQQARYAGTTVVLSTRWTSDLIIPGQQPERVIDREREQCLQYENTDIGSSCTEEAEDHVQHAGQEHAAPPPNPVSGDTTHSHRAGRGAPSLPVHLPQEDEPYWTPSLVPFCPYWH